MAEEQKKTRQFEKHAFTVMLVTVLSRFGGLVREASFSRLIGVSPAMSAFAFAFMVPNLFRRLFGEGALSASLIPELSRLEHDDPAAAGHLAAKILARLSIFLAAVVLVGELILWFLPQGNEAERLEIKLLSITITYMPLVCIAAIAGAILQVRGRFGPAAAMPVVLNVCLIASVILAAALGGGVVDEEWISVVAWGVVVAGVVQASWLSISVYRTQPVRDDAPSVLAKSHTALRQVVRNSIPMIFGLGVLQLNTFMDGLIASGGIWFGDGFLGKPYPLDEDAMAVLTYASRLYEFPLGVFGIAVATAIFPQLSREAGEPGLFQATLRRGIRLSLFIGIPASVGVVLVRDAFTGVVFQGFAFDQSDVTKVATVLMAYSVGIWSYSLNHVLVRGFYARREAMTAVKVGMAMVILNLGLNLFFVFGTSLGVAGLAWSTAICASIQTLVLCILLGSRTGGILELGVWKSIGRTCGCAAVMGGVVWGVSSLLPAYSNWSGSLMVLSIQVTTGGAVFVGLAMMFGMPELRWALGRSASSADSME